MATSVKSRLKSLEEQRKRVEQGSGDGLLEEIATCERQACCLVAWGKHHVDGKSVASVLPDMLRYVDESEARRLLAMDYDSAYRAVGMPIFTPLKTMPKPEPESPVVHHIRMPGERNGDR